MIVDVEEVGAVNVVRCGPRGGAPVVLLHPVGLDATWWGPQFEAFGDDLDVIAVDMPGHGLSADMLAPPTFDLMARVVETVVRELDAGPVHLVGMSVGGMIAQAVAVRRPDLVRSLTLVATLCTFPDAVRNALRERSRVARSEGMVRIAELSIERWFPAAFRARRPDVLDRATRSLQLQSAEFHAAMWDMISGLELEKEIASIRCPTLVIAGEEDINAPRSAAERIEVAIPGSSLVVMPGVGHFPPWEKPQDFNAILRRFLAKS